MFNACMYLHAMYVRYGVYVNHSAMWVQICGSAMYGAIHGLYFLEVPPTGGMRGYAIRPASGAACRWHTSSTNRSGAKTCHARTSRS
ncbi:Uncharacterised protein [uncultured Blautia sp.]|nr:Uncharacterised protein [uncultured Blautia sp.]